jgi:hypothetical protein
LLIGTGNSFEKFREDFSLQPPAACFNSSAGKQRNIADVKQLFGGPTLSHSDKNRAVSANCGGASYKAPFDTRLFDEMKLSEKLAARSI